MKFTISPAPQGSPEWLAARAGRATGSRANDIVAKIKSGEAASRRDYRMELMIERLTGLPTPQGYYGPEMQWGNEQEPFARMAYEEATGNIVEESGFLSADNLMVGVSLDGSINKFEGITEFKCPKTATHVAYLKANVVPSTYIPQMTHELWVTDAQWCDFVSFDPRLPKHLQLFIIRLHRKDVDIAAYEREVLMFLAELNEDTKWATNFKPRAIQ